MPGLPNLSSRFVVALSNSLEIHKISQLNESPKRVVSCERFTERDVTLEIHIGLKTMVISA